MNSQRGNKSLPQHKSSTPANQQAPKVQKGVLTPWIEPKRSDFFALKNLLDPKEQIFFAGYILKINKYSSNSERILLITDKAMYKVKEYSSFLSLSFCSNTPKFTIKRRVDIRDIDAMTFSVKQSAQFVVHVKGENDMRFKSSARVDKIYKCVVLSHFTVSSAPFPIYLRDETDLLTFQTRKPDLSAKRNRRPKSGAILITYDMLPKTLSWIIVNRKSLTTSNKPQEGVATYNQNYNVPQDPRNFRPSLENSYPQYPQNFNQGPTQPYIPAPPLNPTQRPSVQPHYYSSLQSIPYFQSPYANIYVPQMSAKETQTINQNVIYDQEPSRQNPEFPQYGNHNFYVPQNHGLNVIRCDTNPEIAMVRRELTPKHHNYPVQIETKYDFGFAPNYPEIPK